MKDGQINKLILTKVFNYKEKEVYVDDYHFDYPFTVIDYYDKDRYVHCYEVPDFVLGNTKTYKANIYDPSQAGTLSLIEYIKNDGVGKVASFSIDYLMPEGCWTCALAIEKDNAAHKKYYSASKSFSRAICFVALKAVGAISEDDGLNWTEDNK